MYFFPGSVIIVSMLPNRKRTKKCVFADIQDVVTFRNDNMLVLFMKSSTLNNNNIYVKANIQCT